MEWYIMNSSGVQSLVAGLGQHCADHTYRLGDECAATLEELISLINSESACVTKRHLLAERVVLRDLAAIISSAEPDTNELRLTLRLLVELSTPDETVQGTPQAVDAALDLLRLNHQVRSLFVDAKFVRSLLSKIQSVIDEAGQYEMVLEGYDALQAFLLLIRNILHCSHMEKITSITALLGVLLKNGLTSVLLYSVNCHSRDTLTIPAVEVISLLFKMSQSLDSEGGSESATRALDPFTNAARQLIHDKLSCFIIQMLHGGFQITLSSLKRLAITHSNPNNENYYAWIIAYFLPFSRKVSLPITELRGVLSSQGVGFLVHQACLLGGSLLDARADTKQLPGGIENSIYLVFGALDSILAVVSDNLSKDLNKDEFNILIRFCNCLLHMADLWEVLHLFIRRFDLLRFPRSFLAQLVCIQHRLLKAMTFCIKVGEGDDRVVLQHLTRVCTKEMMAQYGLLLECCASNLPETNDALFSMLQYVAVDRAQYRLLYQPSILRSLGKVADSQLVLQPDRLLTKWILDHFLDDLAVCPEACAEAFLDEIKSTVHQCLGHSDLPLCSDLSDLPVTHSQWTDKEESELFSTFAKCENSENMIDDVTHKLATVGLHRTPLDIQEKLIEFGLMNLTDDKEASSQELTEYPDVVAVEWLQDSLLTASYIRVLPKDHCCWQRPLFKYSLLQAQSLTLLPYTEQLEYAVRRDIGFQRILRQLNLLVDGSDVPHISNGLTAGQLYGMAETLGPVTDCPFYKSTISSSSSSDMSSEEELATQKSSSTPPQDHTASQGFARISSSDTNLWLRFMHRGGV